jgi:hypothetical protein
MNEKVFIEDFANILRQTLMLNDVVKKYGLSALDSNIWNLDDEDFKQGLVLVRDETNPAIIEEIFSNIIAFTAGEYERRYKTITKRAVLGIQEGLSSRLLMKVLLSYANLPPDALKKIEYELLSGEDELDIEGEGEDEEYQIENIRHWAMIKEAIEYGELTKGIVFDKSSQTITITADCDNPDKVKELIALHGVPANTQDDSSDELGL